MTLPAIRASEPSAGHYGTLLFGALQTRQSAGGFSTCQKSPGLSNSTPSSHEALSRSAMASTTRQFLLEPFNTSVTITGVSSFIRSGEIKPKPCALTTSVLHSLRKSHVGSRLVTTTGICSDRRVLRLVALLFLSEQRLPYLFGQIFAAPSVQQILFMVPVCGFSRASPAHFRYFVGPAGSNRRSAISWLGP